MRRAAPSPDCNRHIFLTTHIADNWGEIDNHLLPYEGSIDWDQLRRIFHSLDYSRDLLLEPMLVHSQFKDEDAMRKVYPITSVASTVSSILNLPAPVQAERRIIQEIVDDLRACSRVAILASDALGDFIFQQWRHEMPFLDSLHRKRSLLLRSIMPSITCVNFAAMVTGAEMHGHGIKTRYDDMQCESLFDVVRAASGRSAAVGQYGYTGAELLGRHADICGRGKPGEKDEAVERLIIEIVDRDVPQFLITQLATTDDFIHKFGPSSPDLVPILAETDGRLQGLCKHLESQGYGIIVLSDHGQHDVEPGPPKFYRGMHGDDSDEDRLVPCTWTPAS